MKEYQQTYRKNFSLVIIFLILITAALGGALFFAYKLTSKYVENEFASQKIEVLEETIKPYNDFFQNKIPEISFYQGFLDSAQAAMQSARKEMTGTRVTTPPAGPMETNSEQRSFSAQDIASMSMEEYAKYRQRLLSPSAQGKTRGLFG